MNKYLKHLTMERGSRARNLDYPGANDGQMMKNRLVTIERMARILNKAIQDDDKLPTWTTDQVAISEDRLVKVTDYLLSKIERRR
jgi:ribosome recycling factor